MLRRYGFGYELRKDMSFGPGARRHDRPPQATSRSSISTRCPHPRRCNAPSTPSGIDQCYGSDFRRCDSSKRSVDVVHQLKFQTKQTKDPRDTAAKLLGLSG